VLTTSVADEQIFPEGTGFSFTPEEIIIMQAHTLNPTPSSLVSTLELELATGDPAKVPNRLGLIQFYDPYIVVPAHTEATAQMRCRVPEDITVVQSTTHQHTRGTGVQVFLDAPDGTQGTAPFIASTSWESPTVVDEPLAISKGSYVRTICNYLGADQDVIQGVTKRDDEMCMLIAYYYPPIPPEQGGSLFEGCVQDSIPGGVGDQFGAGSKSCAETFSCLGGCAPGDAPQPKDGHIDVGKCWQSCIVSSCPAASSPVNKLMSCLATKCAEACGAGGDCNSCMLASCASEHDACQASTCG
jgi:Copper type II ascorbate-dependent monooxygenase, C-terminal domain